MARQTETPETNMEFVDIPGASLKVSRIALGTWAIGGWMWGGTDEAEAIGVIHEALDHGVTLIDTAPAYGFGRSEEIVGKALAEGGRRKRVLIATKVGLDWKNRQPFRSAGRARIQKEIEDSLKRLRTDVIDIYQVHWPDPNVPIEETAAAMADLQRAGKIRMIGVSNFSPAQIEAFRKVAPVQTVQSPYNLFERAIEGDVLPYCRDRNIVTLAYGSLCRGLLSGRMTTQTQFVGDGPVCAIPASGRDARPVRAGKLWTARHPSCLALGSRPARLDDRALGRPAAGPTLPYRGPRRLAYRLLRHGRNRSDSSRDDHRPRGSGIHGPACSACCLERPKSHRQRATCSTT